MLQKCHFIGIGGIGMSGLARLLIGRNIPVSGSDIASSYVTEGLIGDGAQVFFGHSAQNITSDMKVIYSSDISHDNPEFMAAKNLQCSLLHRSELLNELMQGYKTLAIAGTHGKTTTTALLTHVLRVANYDPSFAVGGTIPKLQVNSGHGEGEYFVAEADESDGTFLRYTPWAAIVTNIDLDHLDHYKSEKALIEAFQTFMNKIPQPERLFFCGDDSRLTALNSLGVSYGFGQKNQLRASNFYQNGWSSVFDIDFNSQHYEKVELACIGSYNVLNALAVFGLALSLGISEPSIRQAFRSFEGVLRRCEKKGEAYSIQFFDDYAHHPTEIQCTLKAVREAVKEKRLLAVYQPHRYSRTRDCLGMFGPIFKDVDEVWITDIYGAREVPIPGLCSQQIVAEVLAGSSTACRYVPSSELLETLGNYLQPHDVVVTVGAGDITHLGPRMLELYAKQRPPRLKVGVVFGSSSVEHEVSLQSANYILPSFNRDIYEVAYFGITREGQWLTGPAAREQLKEKVRKNGRAQPDLLEGKKDPLLSAAVVHELVSCDLLFPILHGPVGEDGIMQGFFEILGKPYVGCDHRSSAICMDKALAKKIMLYNGLATAPFIDFSALEWKHQKTLWLKTIAEQLNLPFFVKPLHLGSTIGVKKVDTLQELEGAIEEAFTFDTHILVENGLKIREIEFAVMGNSWVAVLPPGEIKAEGKVVHYADKYGSQAAPFEPKASLTKELIEEGMLLAKKSYELAGCAGFARIDFFLDEKNKYWFNEINPIPGCTPTSAYPRICEANGISSSELIDRLIIYALERKRRRTP